MKIGIVGQGYVGTAVKTVFEKHYDVETYDLDKDKCSVDYLEDLVKEYEEQTAIDSSLISQKDLQISVLKEREDNYEQQIKLVKPKWYDNKYLWYTYGIASAIIPIYLASQIPGL